MSDVTLLRIGILVAGLILIAAIVFFGRPRKPGQGRRVPRDGRDASARREPTLGEQLENELAGDELPAGGDAATQAELDLFERTVEGGAAAGNAELGRRVSEEFDKIITLYLAARAGEKLHGPDGTRTTVRRLSTEERREEIARMLSGAAVTDEARAQAARLLEAA